jgi:hypothetical protein
VNERYLYLVLDGENKRYAVKLEQIDPRGWEPEQFHLLNIQLCIPFDVVQGVYRVALWLPDMAESLQSDPRYAIQFANENTWDEENGFNVLGKISITGSDESSYQQVSQWSVIKSTSQVLPYHSH